MAAMMLACASRPPAPPASAPNLSTEQMDPGPFPQDYQIRILSWLRMH